MKLSIIIPIYNEAKTISEIVKRVCEVPLEWSKELIVVDDASADGTKGVLASIKQGYPDRVKVPLFVQAFPMQPGT
jgi:glycosyltransferase involved in cell wall biosynthesis